MNISKVKYVKASDPVGKMIIRAAAEGWPGETDLPMPEYDEYMRGACELIANCVRLIRPDESEGLFEIVVPRAQRLIFAAIHADLDELDFDVMLSDFADEFPSRFEDDYILGDAAGRDAFASDCRDFALADS